MSDLHSVIEIGSDSIRMTLAEISGPSKWKVIDRAERPVSIGRDVFLNGRISRESLYESLQILATFQEALEGYQVRHEHIHLVATSAVREARNREIFLERVHNKTGHNIQVIEGVEATHLTFLGVENSLALVWGKLKRSISLILEVGGGSTELMIMNRGKIVSAFTLNIGSVRFIQQIGASGRNGFEYARLLEDYLQTTIRQIQADFDLRKVKHFIAVGTLVGEIGKNFPSLSSFGLHQINLETLDLLIQKLQSMDLEQIVFEYNLPIHEAETLLPTLMINRQFLRCCQCSSLQVTNTTVKNGILQSLSLNGEVLGFSPTLSEQILASANALGVKYHNDVEHSQHVTRLALKIFDEMGAEHGLGQKQRIYLEVAGLLHDVGKFIGHSSHHKHGEYIIANSQIFGLDRQEHRIVGNIVRYHRRAMPIDRHMPYVFFDSKSKITVNKLASILRLADALDRGHNQKIKDIVISRYEEHLTLIAQCDSDIRSEQSAISQKKEMFEEVYGLKVRLVVYEGKRLRK